MPIYLVTARSPAGKKVTERLDATSADEAVRVLRERGYDEIVLHTSDLQAHYQSPKAVNSVVSPRQLLWFRTMPRWLAHVLIVALGVYRKGWYWNLAALALLAYRLGKWKVWGSVETGLAVYLAFPIVFAFVSLSFRGASGTFRKMSEAEAWGRWDEMLGLVDRLAGKLSAESIAFYKAKALAGLGRLDEGLRLVQPFGDGVRMPLAIYWARLAGVYSVAKRREESDAAMARAVECAPNDATVLVDRAESEVWLRHNARSARELLDRARQQAVSDLLQPFVVYTDGLIQLEEGRPREARELLEKALKKASAFRHASPLMEARLDRMHVPLVLACAAEGDLEAARRHYQNARPRLLALKRDDEIARCESAIAPTA
jgi:tetratricopeptide (TPR) repeat protein